MLVEELRPHGTVLELGCGPGGFTRELARHAARVTALDAAPQMLERARREVDAANVSYVQADMFDWEPTETYDLVFFGFVLSHVPPNLFDDFWHLVRRCVSATGRVAFVDEDQRVAHYDEVRDEDGIPVARRTLTDGREFDIVKVFWDPARLAQRLQQQGWSIDVRHVGSGYLVGSGTPH
jgi:trans-aconitate methyltransferase